MDPEYRDQLQNLENLFPGGPKLDGILDMTANPGGVKMRRRGIDGDQDQFLEFWRQGTVAMRDVTECEIRFNELRVPLPQCVPKRIPVALGDLGVGVRCFRSGIGNFGNGFFHAILAASWSRNSAPR